MQNDSGRLEGHLSTFPLRIIPVQNLVDIVFQNMKSIAIPNGRFQKNANAKRKAIWKEDRWYLLAKYCTLFQIKHTVQIPIRAVEYPKKIKVVVLRISNFQLRDEVWKWICSFHSVDIQTSKTMRKFYLWFSPWKSAIEIVFDIKSSGNFDDRLRFHTRDPL